ncbi:MAG: site-specific integrase [Proteobacteria bacterium]|nr:site-specific integrase [Pseudomonadota bacterium]
MPKRSKTEFNENTVKSNRPQEIRYQLRDRLRPGLILRIMPTGTKTWLIELERNCIRKVGDAHLLNLSQAWTKAKKMQGDHLNGKKIESSRSRCPTLQKFLTSKYQDFVEVQHKTGIMDVERLLAACKSLLKTRLDKLSEFQIEKWKAGRLKTAKPNTVRRDLGSLKGALNLAVKWGIAATNPAATVHVKVPKEHRVRYLSDKERERLLVALSERDKEKARARHSGNVFSLARGYETRPEISGYADYLHPLVRLTMNTGLRRGEVLSLKWDQVHLGSNPRVTVTASYAKSGRVRHIPLNSEAVAVLKKWKAQGTGTGWVFPNPNTGHRLQDLKKSWSFLLVRADIQDFRFHDLRHDFASRLVMAGIDLYRVKDLLGHASIQMTEKYSHLAPAALAEAVEVLA